MLPDLLESLSEHEPATFDGFNSIAASGNDLVALEDRVYLTCSAEVPQNTPIVEARGLETHGSPLTRRWLVSTVHLL